MVWRGNGELGDNEHTTAIQYFQSLWLSRCSLGVGHSNSKQCVGEETVLSREPRSQEVVSRVVVGSLCFDAK